MPLKKSAAAIARRAMNPNELPPVKNADIRNINSEAVKNNPGRRHKTGRLEERDFEVAYEHMIESMPVETNFQKIKLLLVAAMVVLFKIVDITIEMEDNIRKIRTNDNMVQFILGNLSKVNEEMLMKECRPLAFLTYDLLKKKMPDIATLLTLNNTEENVKIAINKVEEMSIEENVKAAAKSMISSLHCCNTKEKGLLAYYTKLKSYQEDWRRLQDIVKTNMSDVIEALNSELQRYNIFKCEEGENNVNEEFDADFLEELIFVMTPEPMDPYNCYVN